jgi:hypothetical protein
LSVGSNTEGDDSREVLIRLGLLEARV